MEYFIQNRFSVLKIIVALTGYFVQGKTRLTRVPPSILYVSSGGSARFVWNYTVNNREQEFQLSSPRWTFINANNTPVDIGFDNALYRWKWFINKETCPPRLLNPNRVKKESIATLVISNVTTADSGVYGFIVLQKTVQPIRSKAQLIVTTKPAFNQFSSKAIVEGEDLGINCSATGIPTPNITWVFKGITNEIKSQGVGHAYLVIQNITRKQEGIYTCQATNNPNEVPEIKETQITVLYKPHFLNSSVFNNENKITLRCLVNGQPAPLIKWHDPLGKKITSGTRNITCGSELTLGTTNISDDVFGQYTCNATNKVGYQVHFINVTKKYFPTSPALKSKFKKQVSVTPTVYKNKAAANYSEDQTTSSELLNRISPTLTSNSEKKGKHKSINQPNVNIVPAVVSGVVVSILLTISIFLVIKLKGRYMRNKDDKEVTRRNENYNDATDTQPPVTQAEEGGMSIYAKVDLSKKRKNRQKDEKPIYAQVDLSKKCKNRKDNEKPVYAQVDFSKKGKNRQENSMPIYAQVDLSKKRKNRQEDIQPIYAQVDKNKKKRPGQILYAELEDTKVGEEIPCVNLSSACSTTEYADVDIVPKKSADDSEQIYEVLP